MDTVWFEALHEYLASQEWYDTIGVFIESHCALFETTSSSTSGEFDHGQFTVFREFTEISEQILNNMLSNLGGSLSLLEQALDEHSTLPPTGPRDDARKAMISTLLTYDSFPHFCEMMRSKSSKIDSATTSYYDVNDLDKLTSMGFDKAFAISALNNCDGDFDEALQYLFDNPPPSSRNASPSAPSAPVQASALPFEDFRNTRPQYNKDTKEQVNSSVTSALNKQDSMRRRNSSIATEASAASSTPADQTSGNSNATKTEQTLDYMFKRREQLTTEITEQRKVVVNFTKNPNRVSDDHLEELYLFLKEMVHNGDDLAKHKQKIHTYVFSRITPSQGTIIPNLLSLMLLENEDYLLQKNINRLLSGESLESVLHDQAGNNSTSSSAPPSGPDTSELDVLHRQHALELQRANEALEAEADRQRRKLQEQLKNKRKNRLKQCKDSNMLDEEISRVERQIDEDNAQALSKLDEKLASRNQQTLAGLQTKQIRIIEETARLNRKLTPQELDAINDDIAAQLRDQHAIDLAKMREALDAEKSRQRAALQARLRNKRKKILATSPPPSDQDIADSILNIDLEETNGLNDIDSKFSRQMYNMVQEPTESFAAISTGLRMAFDNMESENWMDNLAKLHKLHCTNLTTMQSSLMDEKSKQQSNLQSRLQAIRQKKLTAAMKRGATPEELEEIEAECETFEAKSRDKLEEKFRTHISEIERSFMEQHNTEIAKIGDPDSIALEKLVAESTFDYESAAAALKAAHDRDVSKHDSALEDEKKRQEDALKEKLAKRHEKKRARMMGDGMTQDEAESRLGKEESQEVKFLRDEWKLEEYIEAGVERGVWRVLKTAGGTRTLTTEESKEEEKTFSNSDFSTANWGWGEEDVEDDEGKRRSIMEKHTDATIALVNKLKDERKVSHNKLRERLEAKKRKRMAELEEGGANSEQIDEVEKELEEEAIKERIQNDRMLTMSEHKAIEEYEIGMNNAAEGGNLNTYELLDEIHSDYKDEREQLQHALMEEKKRQKAELRRKRKERKKEKRRASVVAALEEELMEEDNNEKNLEIEVARIHKANQESKATLDMMMHMEQARQKEALQKRLMRKRAEKRRNSMVAGAGPLTLEPLNR